MAKKIAQSIAQLVGHTPLLELKNLKKTQKYTARIVAKLEYMNPAGSIKDRIAKAMIEEGIRTGKITKDTTIVEPTSGNTGIGLAAIGASYGLDTLLVMPETMSIERRKLLEAYGASLVLTSGSKGMAGAIEEANRIVKQEGDFFMPGQFTNMTNPKTHYLTTGPEIWRDTGGKVAAFVAGVGSGGTLTGAGKYLKEQNPNIKVFAVEPDTSAVLSGEKPGPHKLQGIGAGFVPEVLDTKIYDEVIKVSSKDAQDFTKKAAILQGALVGISSGAALWAAVQVAKRKEFTRKIIVVIFPDTGDRYLSSEMYNITKAVYR